MKKNVFIIALACICVLILALIILLSATLSSSPPANSAINDQMDSSSGLSGGNSVSADKAGNSPQQSITEIPITTMDSVSQALEIYLSSGDYSTLDETLSDIAARYKDNEDQSDDEIAVIDGYRADLAFVMTTTTTLSSWYFNDPEILASAVAFLPVSVKYKAFINRSAALMSPAKDNISLSEAAEDAEVLKAMLEKVNERAEDPYVSIKAYDMTINGRACRFYAARNSHYYYEPLMLTVIDEEYPITCSLADSIIDTDASADLDQIFVTAAPTDLTTE